MAPKKKPRSSLLLVTSKEQTRKKKPVAKVAGANGKTRLLSLKKKKASHVGGETEEEKRAKRRASLAKRLEKSEKEFKGKKGEKSAWYQDLFGTLVTTPFKKVASYIQPVIRNPFLGTKKYFACEEITAWRPRLVELSEKLASVLKMREILQPFVDVPDFGHSLEELYDQIKKYDDKLKLRFEAADEPCVKTEDVPTLQNIDDTVHNMYMDLVEDLYQTIYSKMANYNDDVRKLANLAATLEPSTVETERRVESETPVIEAPTSEEPTIGIRPLPRRPQPVRPLPGRTQPQETEGSTISIRRLPVRPETKGPAIGVIRRLPGRSQLQETEGNS
jgi:hypothetical protein